MKHLFVSAERVLQQNYRYGVTFRLAGSLLILGVILQAPLVVFAFLSWREYEQQIAEKVSLEKEAKDLDAAKASLKETSQKLIQIRQWEPIVRNRLPVSALLNAIQNAIPQTAVLDSLSIESEQFDRQTVPGGVYRVPKSYRLVLQGLENKEAADGEFNEALLGRLPKGSEMIRLDHLEKRSDGLIPFVLLYAVKPTGNYFGLGLKRIGEPDTL